MAVVELRKHPAGFKREPEWMGALCVELDLLLKKYPQIKEGINRCKDCGKLISIVVRDHLLVYDHHETEVQCGNCNDLYGD